MSKAARAKNWLRTALVTFGLPTRDCLMTLITSGLRSHAVLIQKLKHVVTPDVRPAVSEAMTLLRGMPVRRIQPDLSHLVRSTHNRIKLPARRNGVVILGLKEQHRCLRMLNGVLH